MVDIKDLSNITRFSTPINEGSKRKFLLMKEDYLTLKFSVDNPIYFKLGDGIDNELGIFELVDLCKPTYNQNTGGYDYELRLDAYYWKWKNKKIFFTPENAGREASWSLTADLATHMEVFLKNLKALGYKFRESEFVCEIDKTVVSSSKPISYDNCNLIDALTQMAEAWECEWWITNHTINFGRCEYGDPVDFKVGDSADNEGVNVNTMQRSDSQTTYATRIYAFGSDRNIPKTYRKKLVFDAAVDGRYIYDASRKLKDDFFPIGSKIIPQPIENKYLSGEAYGFNTDGKIELEDIIDTNIPAGIYALDLTNVEIKLDSRERANDDSFIPANVNIDVIISGFYVEGDFSSPRFVVKSLKNVKIVASGDGWTYLDIKETFYAQFKYENATFRVCLDVYNIDDTPYWGKFRLYYKGDFIIWKERIRYNTSVTFLSGVNKDKEYKCSYFPEILGKKNVIQMPENTTVSTGDTYTIDNIIKGKVDASYFSKDDNETTINGVVQTRLMLPVNVPYVDAHLNMTQEESVEEIVVFDDVYAKYIGTTKEVPEPEWEFEKDEDDKYPVYTFKDTGLKNFTEDFILDKLRLVFQTGNLSGLDFALKLVKSDDEGTTFRITRSDDYGRFLPDDVLFPQADHMDGETKVLADTYILYGFDTAFLSEDMLPKAEEELLKKAQEYVKKSQIDPSTYNCDMFCQYAYNEGNIRTFEVGDHVNLINKAYFENGRQSRIIGYEWNLDIPYDHPIYTVGETAAYSRIGEIESKIGSLTYKGQTYSGSAVGGGGTSVYVIGVNDKTLPSDKNVFSAKKSLDEITNRAISRLNDDRAAGLITFLKGLISKGLINAESGIEIGNFIDSLTSGSGICLSPNGEIQASSMKLRGSLTVLELIFNRLSAQESDTTYSESGLIESVETLDGNTYRLPLRKRHDTDFAAFDWNDVIYGSVNDLASGGGNYRTSWMRVIGVNNTENYIEVVLYPDSEVPGGKNYPPEPLMAITRRGNTSDEDRQSYWYISSYEKCICMLDGVTKPILKENNYSIIIGKMKRLALFDNLPINYRQSYIYCRGIIRQDDIRVDVTGKPIYELVDRGIWSLAVAASKEPYYFEAKNEITSTNETSTAYHRGVKWQCLKTGTLLEPKWNSIGWAFLEGNGEFSIDFESSKGFSFFYGLIDTVIEAKFFHGRVDVTDDVMTVPGTVITWKRDTGIPAEDKSWSPVFVDEQKNKIHLISNDMGSQWLNARNVTFKIDAIIPLGEENYLRESEELQFNL